MTERTEQKKTHRIVQKIFSDMQGWKDLTTVYTHDLSNKELRELDTTLSEVNVSMRAAAWDLGIAAKGINRGLMIVKRRAIHIRKKSEATELIESKKKQVRAKSPGPDGKGWV